MAGLIKNQILKHLSKDKQQLYLGKRASLIDDATERHIYIIGDFNARPGSAVFTGLSDVCAEGEDEIVGMWGRHLEATLNCVRSEETEAALREVLRGTTLQGYTAVIYAEVQDILRGLSGSEALSMDGLPSGAFKHAPPLLNVWLSVFINACVLHQF
ncbi:hypothetical protein GWK47_003086 [Chionoecetes opilio]|uniref:Endonuclease/exonuclease/phosphatase domain-containing protein n=1 Tax=Chionoecetes opilio TaxID=41210 RepID=A0A8J8WEQ6_CHIOP|nr:hypothetical protein GWK47_003086 [Chionoecetes opilio]